MANPNDSEAGSTGLPQHGGSALTTMLRRVSTEYSGVVHELMRDAADELEACHEALKIIAEHLTNDDGEDPEAWWLELTAEQANLIRRIAAKLDGPNTEVRHARASADAAPSVEGPSKSRPGPER